MPICYKYQCQKTTWACPVERQLPLIQGDTEVIGEIITLKSNELLKEIDVVENYDSFDYETCEYLRKP